MFHLLITEKKTIKQHIYPTFASPSERISSIIQAETRLTEFKQRKQNYCLPQMEPSLSAILKQGNLATVGGRGIALGVLCCAALLLSVASSSVVGPLNSSYLKKACKLLIFQLTID